MLPRPKPNWMWEGLHEGCTKDCQQTSQPQVGKPPGTAARHSTRRGERATRNDSHFLLPFLSISGNTRELLVLGQGTASLYRAQGHLHYCSDLLSLFSCIRMTNGGHCFLQWLKAGKDAWEFIMLAKNTFQRTKIAVDDLTLIQKIMLLLKNMQEKMNYQNHSCQLFWVNFSFFQNISMS